MISARFANAGCVAALVGGVACGAIHQHGHSWPASFGLGLALGVVLFAIGACGRWFVLGLRRRHYVPATYVDPHAEVNARRRAEGSAIVRRDR